MASARERAGGGGLGADELATETAGRRSDGPAPLFVVRVTKGPDTGKSLVLDWNATPEVRVGKSAASELCLSDPRVSRRHLVLRPDGDRVRLVDTASSNGTRAGTFATPGRRGPTGCIRDVCGNWCGPGC